MKRSLIDVISLDKRYGTHLVIVDCSFTIREGDVIGLVGPNGSGKSTLVNLILGLQLPTGGGIKLHLDRSRLCAALEKVSLFTALTGWQNLRFAQQLVKTDWRSLEAAIKRVGLWEHRHKPLRSYSQGMRQRLNLACTLLGEFDVIIFDEPHNGLDPDGFILFRELVQELQVQGATVLICSHLLDQVESLATDILLLEKGKLLEHRSTAELIERYGSLEQAYFEIRR